MPSPHNSPTPSPKSSPKFNFASPPPLPRSSSSESSTITKFSSPLNPSAPPKRTTPLSSSPDTGGIEHRLRVHSTGSTTRTPSPSRVDALSRATTANYLQRGRSPSPHRGGARSTSRGSGSRTPDPANSWWGSRELPARPWVEPPKRKKTIPPEQTERWATTRQVRGLLCDDVSRLTR